MLQLLRVRTCAHSTSPSEVRLFSNILFPSGCPTTLGQGQFIEKAFRAFPSVWRVCSWHKNHRLLQIGAKSTEVSLPIYDACRRTGAIISTGHEHSYARTHQMSSFENFYTNISADGLIHISEGNTVAWVSGVSGYDLRNADTSLASSSWWAATSAAGGTTSVAATYAALICKFNLNGEYRKTLCEMKGIDGRILDSFTMQSDIPDVLSPTSYDNTSIPVCAPGADVELQVASGTENAVETAAGAVSCSPSSLVVGPSVTVAFSFPSVNLTSATAIQSAFLEVVEEVEIGGAINWTIRAELGSAAPLDCSTSFSLSSRTKTSASVSWTTTAADRWYEAGEYKSPDLSTVIGEVVAHASWAPLARINIFVTASSSSSSRTLNSFSRDRCQAASLAISTSSANPSFCVSYAVPQEIRNFLSPAAPSPVSPPQYSTPVEAPAAAPFVPPTAVPTASAPVLQPFWAPVDPPRIPPVASPTGQPPAWSAPASSSEPIGSSPVAISPISAQPAVATPPQVVPINSPIGSAPATTAGAPKTSPPQRPVSLGVSGILVQFFLSLGFFTAIVSSLV